MVSVLILSTVAWVATTEVNRENCMRFLRTHGNQNFSDSFVYARVDQALSTRSQFPWSSQIPDVLFLNDVLPYGVLQEPRDEWWLANSSSEVPNFVNFMQTVVAGCNDVTCAALALNDKAWSITEPAIIFQAAPPNQLNSYSVFQTISQKNSSCTGLSVFLVSALRSVGIPARIAGTPHWNRGPEVCPHGDSDPPCGNHNWVEVWVPPGPDRHPVGWSFIDQRRPDLAVLPLNQSFFYPLQTNQQHGKDEMHKIFASSFANPYWLANLGYPAGTAVVPATRFPLVWNISDFSVRAWDMTREYWRKLSSEGPNVVTVYS